MYLNVKQRGDHVATFRWIEVRLMETLAAWVPTTPEMEVKLLFGEHIWDAAQHADALGKRTFELRLPLQHSLGPAGGYVDLLADVARVTDSASGSRRSTSACCRGSISASDATSSRSTRSWTPRRFESWSGSGRHGAHGGRVPRAPAGGAGRQAEGS